MINIFEKDATEFDNNGLATLEPDECLFKPAINGVWQLDMVVPYDAEKKSDLIANDRILRVTGIDCVDGQHTQYSEDYQLFRIYDFKKGDNNISVIAYPIALDARFNTFTENIKLYDKTVIEAVSAINQWLASYPNNRYTVKAYGEHGSTKHSGEYNRANLISIMNGENGFVQTWGGEICYDNYEAGVYKQMGTQNPVDVRYGKNILGMEYDKDASNVITRLYPKAKSGEILNGVADYSIGILPTPYVDADNASDYPIDHIYAVDAPYNLVQLSNDGSAEYLDSQNLFDSIMQTTRFWLHTGLLNSTSGYYTSAPLLEDVELDWIINNYALTTEKDGVEGIVEHMWRQVITNSTHNIVSKSVQNLIYSAMKAAFDEVLTDDESGWYIGSSSKKLWSDGFGQYFYSYTWDAGGQFRVNGNGTGYAWVYANSKWNQLDSSGTTTGATDKATWKWYKVKNKKWKRYGNKKKSRYLHHQTWKINDVWYWFKNDGEPQKGSALYNEWILFFDNKAVAYEQGVEPATLYGALIPICTEGERLLFQRLYNRMTEYCEELFDANKLSYPTISIDINFADLSQTVEYQNYSFLEKIHLGDTVNIRNDKLGVPTLTERIIGLTYDVLRKCNTEIHIGLTESSVVNLLNSIGKTDNQTKFVAGEGITIENNVISVNPPETPYLEDVIVNGASVVRNHKAYLDLDEMGIDETIDVLYGEDEPDTEEGEDKDFYFRMGGEETIDVITNQDVQSWNEDTYYINLTSFEKTSRNEFNFTIAGLPSNYGAGENLWFPLHNCIEGNSYNISFDLRINGQFSTIQSARDKVVICDNCVIELTPDTLLHSYSATFTYDTSGGTRYSNALRFNPTRVKDDTPFIITVTNLKIEGNFFTEFNELYNRYEDAWRKYIPKVMVGATDLEDGYRGVVPSPTIADKNKFLRGDGTWQDAQGASAVSDLTDISLNSLANGEILKYNSSTSKWENSTESSAISSLTDVDLNNLADGEILKYNATASKWENAVESGGSSAGLIIDAQIYSTDEKQVGVWTDGKPLYQKTIDKSLSVITNHATTLSILGTEGSGISIKNYVGFFLTDSTFYSYSYYKDSSNCFTATLTANNDDMNVKPYMDVSTTVYAGIITIWYTKDSDVAGSGGFQAYGFSPLIYSEEERVIGIWRDNKPLYAKTFVMNGSGISCARNAWTVLASISTDINCIACEGMEGDYTIWNCISVYNDRGSLKAWNVRDRAIVIKYLTLYYTKTSDTAGSGSYNTLEVPMVHYSTSEQVIGTWTDGSTLYQKTVTTGGSAPSGATLRERVEQVGCDTIKYTK